MKILLKKNLHFFQGNPFTIFSKITLLSLFFKNSLQEGNFENSLKFLQLAPNLTPIRNLLCTFSPQCCYYHCFFFPRDIKSNPWHLKIGKWSRVTFRVTGVFSGNCHGYKKFVTGVFFEICHGLPKKCHGLKFHKFHY